MHTGRFELIIDSYRFAWDRGRPYDYARRREEATLVDEIALDEAGESVGVLSVGWATGGWPFLVIEHGHVLPWTEDTLRLDVLLVPETNLLFVGAHETVAAYDLRKSVRLWHDTADTGFHAWHRYGEVVLMAAELELAAWTIHGDKLCSTFVEPPYEYVVADDTVHLTVMDVRTTFPLASGPSWGRSLPWRQ